MPSPVRNAFYLYVLVLKAFVTPAPKSIITATINGIFLFLLDSFGVFLSRRTTLTDVFIVCIFIVCIIIVNRRASERCGGTENMDEHILHTAGLLNFSTSGMSELLILYYQFK